jgi:pyrroline-5-carboxylate reductase
MQPIGFIGAGTMAEAIISGLLRKTLLPPRDIIVFDIKPGRMEHMKNTYGVEVARTPRELVLARDVIVLSVKPDQILKVLAEIGTDLTGKLVISIAAGITLGSMLDILGSDARVIRVMPNTHSIVLEGASVMAASPLCSEQERDAARTIFSAVGMCLEMDERHINAVTALSGSGPAFCFLFLEALSDGAVQAGLPRDVALKLAAATMRGAATMMLDLKRHPGQLKDMVTSPSGTTIEGIAALESRGFRSAVIEAVSAAFRRAETLSGKA